MPYEAIFGKKLDLSGLHKWGEKLYVQVENKESKLGGRVCDGRWLGVEEQSKGLRIYWLDTKSITVEHNVYYDDMSASCNEEEQDEVVVMKSDLPKISTTPEITTPDVQVNNNNSDIKAPNTCICKPSKHVQDILEGNATWSNWSKAQKLFPRVQLPTLDEAEAGVVDWATNAIDVYALAAETTSSKALEPQSLSEAKLCPDQKLWEKAIEEELATLKDTGTWKLVNTPEGVNVVGYKWVFHAKKDAAGNVIHYKAQLVAQGFSQVPKVDYFNTYAPAAQVASISTILVFAAAEDLETGQINIKGAYLNREPTENKIIYMKQPPGYAKKSPDSKILTACLYKTLYGLKKAGHCWYQTLVEIMMKLGFLRSEVDSAVFLPER